MRPFSDSLVSCVSFANFCKKHDLEPHKFAKFMQLIGDRARLAVRICNRVDTNGAMNKRQAKLEQTLETEAKNMGFDGIEYPDLFPVLVKDGKMLHLPTLV